MKQHPFFSIIIPVYNGLTNGLPNCLDSIWSQPLDKELYEVICVDDCSTDDTRAWLKEQQARNTNLYVIENEINIRQGGGRNKGVRAAKGEYIAFIDCDDYFHKDSLAKVYHYIKCKNLDILISDSAYQFKGYEHNNLQLNFKYTEETNGENFIKENGVPISPWRFCINREFYLGTGCMFIENRQCEDVDWAANIIYYAKQIQYQPILLVHYNIVENSTTGSTYKNKRILSDCIAAANRCIVLSNTLYKESICKSTIISLANSYYKRTCMELFGLFCNINDKKSIIKDIAINSSPYKIVDFAIKNPTTYAIITNCFVPLYRVTRKIHRKRNAKSLQNK